MTDQKQLFEAIKNLINLWIPNQKINNIMELQNCFVLNELMHQIDQQYFEKSLIPDDNQIFQNTQIFFNRLESYQYEKLHQKYIHTIDVSLLKQDTNNIDEFMKLIEQTFVVVLNSSQEYCKMVQNLDEFSYKIIVNWAERIFSNNNIEDDNQNYQSIWEIDKLYQDQQQKIQELLYENNQLRIKINDDNQKFIKKCEFIDQIQTKNQQLTQQLSDFEIQEKLLKNKDLEIQQLQQQIMKLQFDLELIQCSIQKEEKSKIKMQQQIGQDLQLQQDQQTSMEITNFKLQQKNEEMFKINENLKKQLQKYVFQQQEQINLIEKLKSINNQKDTQLNQENDSLKKQIYNLQNQMEDLKMQFQDLKEQTPISSNQQTPSNKDKYISNMKKSLTLDLQEYIFQLESEIQQLKDDNLRLIFTQEDLNQKLFINQFSQNEEQLLTQRYLHNQQRILDYQKNLALKSLKITQLHEQNFKLEKKFVELEEQNNHLQQYQQQLIDQINLLKNKQNISSKKYKPQKSPLNQQKKQFFN